ncbi:MAG: hypothetical protein ACKOE5_07565 [Cytophagales bacterium]
MRWQARLADRDYKAENHRTSRWQGTVLRQERWDDLHTVII